MIHVTVEEFESNAPSIQQNLNQAWKKTIKQINNVLSKAHHYSQNILKKGSVFHTIGVKDKAILQQRTKTTPPTLASKLL